MDNRLSNHTWGLIWCGIGFRSLWGGVILVSRVRDLILVSRNSKPSALATEVSRHLNLKCDACDWWLNPNEIWVLPQWLDGISAKCALNQEVAVVLSRSPVYNTDLARFQNKDQINELVIHKITCSSDFRAENQTINFCAAKQNICSENTKPKKVSYSCQHGQVAWPSFNAMPMLADHLRYR